MLEIKNVLTDIKNTVTDQQTEHGQKKKKIKDLEGMSVETFQTEM